jgi:Sulfotransferase domain
MVGCVKSSGYLREVAEAIFLRKTAGRLLTVFADDVFLVSYPHSGNTWARFLIGNLLRPESPITSRTLEHIIPSIYLLTDRALARVDRPRIIQSHEPFDARYPSVIYLVRDPRDVLVSRYHSGLKRRSFSAGCSMEEFARLFVSGGADLDQRIGPWGDHVMSWLAMKAGEPNFLLVRYEDLQRNTTAQLARLACFLKVEVDRSQLSRALELSSPERRGELDEREPGLRGTPGEGEGIEGRWESQLSEGSICVVESSWWPLMNLLGYEPVCAFSNGPPRTLLNEGLCEGLAAMDLSLARTARPKISALQRPSSLSSSSY